MSPSDKSFIPFGVPGLDDVLGGGLRPGHLYLVEGSTGTGKTTLGLQYTLEGARLGQSCLIVSLTETAAEIQTMAESHGWSLDGVEVRDLSESGEPAQPSSLFDLSEVELGERVQSLVAEMDTLRPDRLLLDTLSALRALSGNGGELRRHVELFRAKANALGCTTVVADDNVDETQQHQHSLAWGIIRLEQRISAYGAPRRRLWVPKLRGQPYVGGYHDFRIETGGIAVYPRIVRAGTGAGSEAKKAETVSSGVPPLDALLGGGLQRGTSTAIIGPPGCGKSTLACTFARAAAARKERAAFFLFDESIATFRLRATAQRMNIDTFVDGGHFALRKLDPAELSPGEFSRALAEEAEEKGASLIIIDSLNGFLQAMRDEGMMNLHVHGLLRYLSELGVLSLVTLSQTSPLTGQQNLGMDLSYITDTVIAQRYFEAFGTIRYALSVLKKRYGDHERTIREYRIGTGGINLGQPLTDFRGILTGFPRYRGDNDPLL